MSDIIYVISRRFNYWLGEWLASTEKPQLSPIRMKSLLIIFAAASFAVPSPLIPGALGLPEALLGSNVIVPAVEQPIPPKDEPTKITTQPPVTSDKMPPNPQQSNQIPSNPNQIPSNPQPSNQIPPNPQPSNQKPIPIPMPMPMPPTNQTSMPNKKKTFITDFCKSDSDCESNCCGFKSGRCAGPVVAQERDGGCGFGDKTPNDTAARKLGWPFPLSPKL